MQKKIIQFFALLILLGTLCTKRSWGQMNRDLFGVDYAYIGPGEAENGNGVSFNKLEARFMLPQKLKKPNTFLFHKFSYANVHVGYESEFNVPDELKNFTTLGYSLGLSTPLRNDWRFTAMLSPTISSNFESSISFSDIRLFGMVIFTKPINQQKNLTLSLGAMYSSTLGIPAPLPLVSLQWKPNQDWTFNFGFPRMEATYKWGKSTEISANLVMMGENFTLTDNLRVQTPDGQTIKTTVDNVKLSNMAFGLTLNQKITKHWRFNISSGYTFRRIYEFADGTDKIIDFNLDNNIYLKAGIAFGF